LIVTISRSRPWPILLVVLAAAAPRGERPVRAQIPPTTVYAVATLAPADVAVPRVVLEEGRLHALLVELGAGTTLAGLGPRIGATPEELARLLRLAEEEHLGRLGPEGNWQPLAPALDGAAFGRLEETVIPLAEAIADSLEADWTALAGRLAALPLAGRITPERSGYGLVGAWILGTLQADLFWRAGMAPDERAYAFRVFRVPPRSAPRGLRRYDLGGGWTLADWGPDSSRVGLERLLDGTDPLAAALGAPGEEGRVVGELVEAYRLWYLLEVEPDPPTRRLFDRLGLASPGEGPAVPLVSTRDLEAMGAIARDLGTSLWPLLGIHLAAIGELAAGLGYGEEGQLGEFILWSWELATEHAVELLARRGILSPPGEERAQVLLIPEHR
jgi:hypothetical protein